VLRCDILAEMLAHEILSMGHDVGKALNIVEERRRERALKKTVNKNKTGSSLEQQEGADVVERGDARRRLRQRERSLGNRRDARKAPRLLLHVRKPQVAEAGDAAGAQLGEPGRSAGRAIRRPRVVG